MEQALIDAIRDGDLAAVRRCLSALPVEAQWQDEGRAAAGEVVRSGGPGLAQLLYAGGELVPSGPWGDVDPVVWAAEHGVIELLENLLLRYPAPEATLRVALNSARAWLDVDPEAELRRRSGMADDNAVTVARDHLAVNDFARVLRIRLTSADGRRAEVLAAHRAVVTALEKKLDLPVSRDELLARALWPADPESYDWNASLFGVMWRFPAEETFRWAAVRLADPDVAVRRFTAELLHMYTVAEEAQDAPYATDALAVLRERMVAETDTETLCDVLGAYGGFSEIDAILYEFLPFVADHRSQVRSRVAGYLLNGTGGLADDPPHRFLEALLSLASDPDPTVRAAATASLMYRVIDTPALRKLLVTQMNGDDRQVQINAATGLALRGDAHALAELRRMSDEDGYESPAWYQFDSVEHMLAQRARS